MLILLTIRVHMLRQSVRFSIAINPKSCKVEPCGKYPLWQGQNEEERGRRLLELLVQSIPSECQETSKMTAFFQRLLHWRVHTKVCCASLWLTSSRKLVSSTRHREQSIIAVQSCLQIKWLCERKNYWHTCVRITGRCENGNICTSEQL